MNWRDLLLHNLRWKLFSLLIAFLVWNTYHLGPGSLDLREEIFDTSATGKFYGVVVRVLTPQDTPYAWRVSPSTVEFKLEGSRSVVDLLNREALLVYVDAADYRDDGTNLVSIRLRLPEQTRLLEVTPAKVELIRTNLTATLAPDFPP